MACAVYDAREKLVRSIVHRIQRGDSNAVSELIPLYKNLIWEAVHQYFGDNDEDAYAAGMYRLWREAQRHDLKRGTKFITTLKRGLSNAMKDVRKSRKRAKVRQADCLLIEDVYQHDETRCVELEVKHFHEARLTARYLADED